jgi:hypothetical protein
MNVYSYILKVYIDCCDATYCLLSALNKATTCQVPLSYRRVLLSILLYHIVQVLHHLLNVLV